MDQNATDAEGAFASRFVTGGALELNSWLRQEWREEETYAALREIVITIATASKHIHRAISAAGLVDVLGSTGKVNVQGEVAQRLDRIATEVFSEALRRNEYVGGFACEELESEQIVSARGSARYLCVFDPIDGSSNIDVAVPIGSIFGFYRVPDGEEITAASFLRAGREQIGAAYVIYGSSTQLVLATTGGVNIFTLDTSVGEYRLTSGDVKIPDDCPYYSVNEGNFDRWSLALREAVTSLRARYSLRYVGTLVSDFHRGLLKGGIFMYPADAKNPDGKLRLLYEASPMAFIAERAGGAANSGSQRILDIKPTALHQRTPLFIGNTQAIKDIEKLLVREAGGSSTTQPKQDGRRMR